MAGQFDEHGVCSCELYHHDEKNGIGPTLRNRFRQFHWNPHLLLLSLGYRRSAFDHRLGAQPPTGIQHLLNQHLPCFIHCERSEPWSEPRILCEQQPDQHGERQVEGVQGH